MDEKKKYVLAQLDNHLATSHQSWLFGAGISCDAGIPLMGSLTDRIFTKAGEQPEAKISNVLNIIKDQLSEDSHIEHILSHLGDHRAIADRSRNKSVTLEGFTLSVDDIDSFHQTVLAWIAETIRWGYQPASSGISEKIGTHEDRIVDVKNHSEFISALFNRNQAGMAERRRAVRIFTTNYDTLIEDALAIEGFSYWDGFTGGAIAYRSHRYGDDEPKPKYHAHVIKLHGSIDWHLGPDDRVLRVRDGDIYPNKTSRVLIYPQSTKYIATQRDPFSAQFDLLRRSLGSRDENVLVTCGYSFGDEHINQEIELTLQRPENKTTILAFVKELNPILENWRVSSWGKRVYAITENGVYVGSGMPQACPENGKKQNWWTFAGVTEMLNSGAEACGK